VRQENSQIRDSGNPYPRLTVEAVLCHAYFGILSKIIASLELDVLCSVCISKRVSSQRPWDREHNPQGWNAGMLELLLLLTAFNLIQACDGLAGLVADNHSEIGQTGAIKVIGPGCDDKG
jgi:hypothetical protein